VKERGAKNTISYVDLLVAY